ncbi:MAG: hypothetical protein ACR2FZ_01855 [Thermoleophilaceae bacterium]
MAGPFLQTAVLCEKVLTEANGVFSAIRIVDRFTTHATGADVPDEMPPGVIDLTALVIVKAGDARGRFAIRLRPERPSGRQMDAIDFPIRFDGGPDQGQGLVLPMQMEMDEEGLYWIDVFLVARSGQAETLMTRMPLTIRYQPQRINPPE